MPKIDLDYGAFTIDTCVFERHGVALEKGLLKQLEQFSGGPVSFILADIIDYELTSHLSDKIKTAREKVSHAVRASAEQQLSSQIQNENARALLFGEGNDEDIAKKRISEFYIKSGAQIVATENYADVSRLIRMYFYSNPPFDNAGKKKHEFPDALALLSLEKWAQDNNTRLLAVSTDNGWKQFADTSDYIDVNEDLADTISHFQPHNAAQEIISELASAISRGQNNSILDSITSAIEESLEGAEIHIEANSDHYYEESDVYAKYSKHKFIDKSPSVPEINVIRIEAGHLILQLAVEVVCEVHCTFSLSVRDPIDRDYLSLGDNPMTVEENYQTELLIFLSGDFSRGLNDLTVDKVEVFDTIDYADFGDVTPDWGYEE